MARKKTHPVSVRVAWVERILGTEIALSVLEVSLSTLRRWKKGECEPMNAHMGRRITHAEDFITHYTAAKRTIEKAEKAKLKRKLVNKCK